MKLVNPILRVRIQEQTPTILKYAEFKLDRNMQNATPHYLSFHRLQQGSIISLQVEIE